MLDLIRSAINSCEDAYIFDWEFDSESGILIYGGESIDTNSYSNESELVAELVETVEMMS